MAVERRDTEGAVAVERRDCRSTGTAMECRYCSGVSGVQVLQWSVECRYCSRVQRLQWNAVTAVDRLQERG